MIFKSIFTNVLILCTILLFSSCQKPVNNEVSVNETRNSSLSTSNSSKSTEEWLMPILSEYLADESIVQGPPVPPITPTQNIAINERLAVPITIPVSGVPSFSVSNGFIASYVNHTNSEVIFDLQVGDNVTLEHSDDEIQVDVLNSAGQLIGRQKYLITTIFADAQVIVSLEDIGLDDFNTAIIGKGYSVSNYDSVTQKATVDIGMHSTTEALAKLHDIISPTLPKQSLRKQGLTSNIRAIAGPNYAYKSDRHLRRSTRILLPTCDVKNDLEEFASDWDPINDLVNLTNASEAHEEGFYGDDIVIILLDSGVDDEDVFDCPDTPQKDGHGTHVKNIVKSLAPNVTLVSKRIFNSDGIASIDNLINTNDLLQALKDIEIEYLLNNKRVILNMSFSAPVHPHHGHDLMFWGTLADLYDFYSKDLLIVTSAGNHGLDEEYKNDIFYPAGFSRSFRSVQQSFVFDVPGIPNIISIGSAGLMENELTASDYNPPAAITDFLAYGVKLCKTDPNATTCTDNTLTGSSFSAPVVSAIAALNWQRCNTQPSYQIRNLLYAQSSLVPNSDSNSEPRLITYNHAFDCDANPVIPAPKATQLATGGDFSCLLREIDSQIYCWGLSPAQFANVDYTIADFFNVAYRPDLIKTPQGVQSWNTIAAEDRYLCALSNSGQLYCWGKPADIYAPIPNYSEHLTPFQLINPPEVTYWETISSRCGLANNNEIYCWEFIIEGNNSPVSLPIKITKPLGVNSWLEITNDCAIGDDNQAYCWGDNSQTGLGNEADNYSLEAIKVITPQGVNSWEHISRYPGQVTCAISNTDQAYCWGFAGALGNGSSNSDSNSAIPTIVTNPTGVTSWQTLSSKYLKTCGVADNGEAYCWGVEECGYFTMESPCDWYVNLPRLVNRPSEVSGWQSIHPSPYIGDFACALNSEKEPYCWGNGVSGRLGNGIDEAIQYTPVRVLEIP